MAVTISWRDNGVAIQNPVNFGDLEALDTSATKTISLSHDFRQSIVECGLFISPSKIEYTGSRYPQFDYDQIIKYGTEYPGYGLGVKQTFLATGTIDDYSGDRVVDFERLETVNIFTQAALPSLVSAPVIEILDGPSVGETSAITGYNSTNTFFDIEDAFSTDVTGAQYQIQLQTLDYVKHQKGTSADYPILLLNQGGIIARNESVDIELFMKVPKFPFAASKLLVDFNLTFFATNID